MSFSLTATDTTITVDVTAVEGRSYYRLYWRLASQTGSASTTDVQSTTDFTYVIENLTPETTYAVNVAHWETSPAVDGDDGLILMASPALEITTDASEPVRPKDWEWSGVAAGLYIPTYGGDLAPVTADDWNRFCSRINEFRLYKSMTEYSFTSISQGMRFSSTPVKQAIAAINGISGAGSTPATIEPLKASFWLQLASALNAVE